MSACLLLPLPLPVCSPANNPFPSSPSSLLFSPLLDEEDDRWNTPELAPPSSWSISRREGTSLDRVRTLRSCSAAPDEAAWMRIGE